jgi:hypothetical protein
VRVPSLRERVADASLPIVNALSRVPRAVPFVAVLALMLAGIFVPGWGWVFLLVVVAFLAWTLYLAWPALDQGARAGRIAVLLIAVAITITQAVPQT